MKKLNLFVNSKRSSREITSGPVSPSAPTDTLHRIVNAKEEAKIKWEKEQEEFRQRQRDHEIKMIEMEQAEVKRREEEVRKLGEDLDETRRKNRQIQDRVQEQIIILQRKLEEYKMEHKSHEESMEDEIGAKEDIIANVKLSLDNRMKMLDVDFGEAETLKKQHSFSSDDDEQAKRLSNVYPNISQLSPLQLPTVAPRQPQSRSWTSKIANQSQKSPPLPSSMGSTRSNTPRTDSASDENVSL